MIGGGETALMWLSRGLAQAGHDVDLFYDTARPGNYEGINFLPKALREHLLSTKDYDVLISWEDLPAARMSHRAKFVIFAIQCNAVDSGITDWGIDRYQVVSNWHQETIYLSDQRITPSKFLIFPNGVDLRRYEQPHAPRDPFRVIHSSSPDRGLHHLLRIWPRIKRKVPEANLQIFYDMDKWFSIVDQERQTNGWELNTSERADLVREGLERCKGLDVVRRGAVDQWTLAVAQMEAGLGVYPCDPVARTEGFSNTVLEYMAARLPVIISNADAFPELWAAHSTMLSLPVDDDEWVDAIVDQLRSGLYEDSVQGQPYRGWVEAARQYAEGFSWHALGQRYAALLEEMVWEKGQGQGQGKKEGQIGAGESIADRAEFRGELYTLTPEGQVAPVAGG